MLGAPMLSHQMCPGNSHICLDVVLEAVRDKETLRFETVTSTHDGPPLPWSGDSTHLKLATRLIFGARAEVGMTCKYWKGDGAG